MLSHPLEFSLHQGHQWGGGSGMECFLAAILHVKNKKMFLLSSVFMLIVLIVWLLRKLSVPT